MNNHNTTSIKILSIFMMVTWLASCTNSSTSGKKSAKMMQEEKTIHDIEQLLEDLPPPSLVPFMLDSINAEFDSNLVNEITIVKYEGNSDKMMLNMGVYASDINYLAAYGHEDDCLDYLNAAHKLAELLGDSAIYDNKQLAAFKGHIKNQSKEDISKLLGALFLKTSIQMEEDHHLKMAGLALTGSFVEGLYHAVVTIESFPETPENDKLLEPLVKIVLGEEKALLDIITVLEDLPFDDTIADMITELSILDRLYKGDLEKIEKNMADDPNYILTKDLMRDVTIEVKRIRKSIVE